MNGSRLFWGILFLLFGLIFLGINIGILPSDSWWQILRFWPVLLILWGVSILFRKKEHFGPAYITISIALILLVVASLFYSQNYRVNEKTLNISEEINPSYSKAEITLNTGASEVSIADESDKLVAGEVKSFGQPVLHRSISGDHEVITINQTEGTSFNLMPGGHKNSADLKLTDKVEYGLLINTGASSLDIDLAKLKVSSFELNCGASSAEIKVGNLLDLAKLKISAGASSFKIKLPENSAVRVINKSGLTSTNFDAFGLKKTADDRFESENYSSANKKIDLEFSSGVSSLELIRYNK